MALTRKRLAALAAAVLTGAVLGRLAVRAALGGTMFGGNVL